MLAELKMTEAQKNMDAAEVAARLKKLSKGEWPTMDRASEIITEQAARIKALENELRSIREARR